MTDPMTLRDAEHVLRGMKRNDRQAIALQLVLDAAKATPAAFVDGWMAARHYYGSTEHADAGDVVHGAECQAAGNPTVVCTCDPSTERVTASEEARRLYARTEVQHAPGETGWHRRHAVEQLTAESLQAACADLTLAGDRWHADLLAGLITSVPVNVPGGAQILAHDHPSARDRITIQGHTLYRDDETNEWHVLGWSDASRARFLPRRRPLAQAGTPAPPLPEANDGDHGGWS